MRKKRAFAVGLVLAAFMLGGCSGSGRAKEAPKDTPKETTAAAAAETAAAEAAELDYPKKDISVIIPFAAGGGTDLTGRGFLNTAEKYTGARFLVTNVTGSGGWAGWQQTAAEDADGYTLALITINILTDSGTDLTYKDFVPLATLSRYPTVFAVPADSDIHSIAELKAAAEAAPGSLRVAVGGIDDVDHINAKKFEEMAGVQFSYVPYNGGAESISAALGGNVEVVVCNTPEVAGREDMRVLSVWADERLATLPEVPTMKEEGYDIVVTRFRSLAAPAGTPEEILDYLEEAFAKTAEDSEWMEYANSINAEPDYLNRADSEAYLDQMNSIVNAE